MTDTAALEEDDWVRACPEPMRDVLRAVLEANVARNQRMLDVLDAAESLRDDVAASYTC